MPNHLFLEAPLEYQLWTVIYVETEFSLEWSFKFEQSDAVCAYTTLDKH